MLSTLEEHTYTTTLADKDAVIVFLVQKMVDQGKLTHPQRFYDLVLKREQIGSTHIGKQTALPHARIDGEKCPFFITSAFLESPINWDGTEKVQRVILIKGPKNQEEEYLRLLSEITTHLKED